MKKSGPTEERNQENRQDYQDSPDHKKNRTAGSDGYRPFAKDKRQRIKRTEKAVPARREEDGPRSEPAPRRSYNPNFDKDNKPRFDRKDTKSRYNKDDRAGRPDKPYRSDKPAGEGKFGSKPGGRPMHGDRNNRKSFGKPAPRRDRQGMINGEYPKFAAPFQEGTIRLNRYLANAGICSRREADDNIRLGLVSVNGETVTEMGTRVSPGDIVKFNGDIVRAEKKVYILMNKPKGFVTTVEDPNADKTVMDLLNDVCQERVYPVGRLDKNSLGVLLFTNDGDLTKKLTHPSHNKKKIYQVALDKALTQEDMNRIIEGVELEDGPIRADNIDYVNANRKEIGIEIHSGRNRIIRRIFDHLGYKVQKLDRVYFAGLTKKNLKRGSWRFLTPKEVDILRSGMYE